MNQPDNSHSKSRRRASVYSSVGQRKIELCASCQAQAARSYHIELCEDCRDAIAPVVEEAKEEGESYKGTEAIVSVLLGAAGATVVARNLVAALWDNAIRR